jgi:hypothetical protein
LRQASQHLACQPLKVSCAGIGGSLIVVADCHIRDRSDTRALVAAGAAPVR